MQDVWSTAGKARWQGLHWGFLLAVSPERTGQSVSVFLLLLESMLKFGFAGKCDFIWVALGKAAFASLLISKVPLSENQSLEVSWKAVNTIQNNGCQERRGEVRSQGEDICVLIPCPHYWAGHFIPLGLSFLL